MIPPTTPITSTAAAGPAAADADRASEDEKKARQKQFVAGLERAQPAAAPAVASQQGGAQQTQSREPATTQGTARPEGADAQDQALEAKDGQGDDAGGGDAAGGEADAGKGPPGLLDVIARRAVAKTAQRVLRQRVVEHAPMLADAKPVDMRAGLPRELGNEKKVEKKSVVEEAQRDPEVAVQAGAGLLPLESPAPAAPAAALRQGHPVAAQTFRQMVAFAEVHKDRSGVIEFALGLRGAVLGGAKIIMRSFGDRKVGLRIENGVKDAIRRNDVDELVEALRRRNLEIVEVEIA